MLPLASPCRAAPSDDAAPGALPPAIGAPGGLPPIERVAIGDHREFRVNGQPFLPIMGWLQGPTNFARLKAVGINTITGYHWTAANNAGAGNTKNAAEYGALARAAGLYFISPFMKQHPEAMQTLKASDNLLAWIHRDEPELPHTVSDAQVMPESALIINKGSPLWKMLDGNPFGAAVLDPLEGAQFTIKLKQPVTVTSLAVWVTAAPRLAVAKEVLFSSDGKEILKVSVENKKGRQKFDLAASATFSNLTVQVLAINPGEVKYGSIGEIEAFDAAGTNVLLAPPRKEPRQTPQETMADYREIKAFDPSRPVLMTVTSFFINDAVMHSWYTKERSDRLYPEYFKAADVPGFDVYPIYGWNRPEKLHWVSQGVRELRAYEGGRKPTYVWIEVQPGGEFGEKAQPVTGVEIRHEVYQAIINGATGIGYFTHQFKPKFSEFGVPGENQKALLEINQQLQRLAPVILGADAKAQPKIVLEGGLPAQLLTKQAAGSLTIFAQNMDMERRGGQATISVDGLPAGAIIEVVDENRTLTAEAGRFIDSFAPLAVHIYRLKAAE
ncbi:MAG: hypothetical protein M3347_12455 [Armatimonadota bacterium]|nr:hypothetical protein [Armatimonadota bacterium]